MIFQKSLEPYLTKLLSISEKKLGKEKNYFIKSTFWDDGDFEITLCSSWGFIRHEYTYRKSLDNYYYKEVEIGNHNLGDVTE